jgi:hypothetical protein
MDNVREQDYLLNRRGARIDEEDRRTAMPTLAASKTGSCKPPRAMTLRDGMLGT